MKKLFKALPMVLLALAGTTALSSCSDDNDEPIAADKLPSQAKVFIQQYYPTATILTAQKDRDDYEVTLSEGTRIEFNKSGEWIDVDAAPGNSIAKGFYPAAIDIYVGETFNGTGINEISKETHGYDVELISGTDLKFNQSGSFIGYDR